MGVSHLPHLTNITAGSNRYDPVHNSIFEIVIDFPPGTVDTDMPALLSEQVVKVDGLDALNRLPGAKSQKFYGVDVSYLEPVLSDTRATFTITFNLNLRNSTDNYVLKAFREWGKRSYDISTGQRTLKSFYCAGSFKIAQANRNGDVWRTIQFYDVFITKIEGLADLDYSSADAKDLKVSFVSDYWDEVLA